MDARGLELALEKTEAALLTTRRKIAPITFVVGGFTRAEKYRGEDGERARSNLIDRWQAKWRGGTYGRWTHYLIPDVQKWIGRPYGEVDYFLTQALSGHGSFRKYLFERHRAVSDACKCCAFHLFTMD
ncbi:hypothetical protein NQ317_016993 [Molorchus minor]|uniref:Uncharacterized protein n=1 Tax=Molorchus minor TaxID=1323400 RepID=A0ABQ9JLB4_9CUCU|nr:hypothetical protein NQ317_016993 [Molorchus minor]